MIEYLYDAIRATAGEDIVIAAEITDNDGSYIREACQLMLYDNEDLITTVDGQIIDNIWYFTIPAKATTGLTGRYFYCISHYSSSIAFKQPIYLK